MSIVLFYFITLAFTYAAVMYAQKQFEDEKAGWANSQGKWHPYGAFQRSTPFIIGLLVKNIEWYDVLLAASICIPAFEIGINKIALHMPIFYNGATSTLDKTFKNKKWYFMGILLVIAILIRTTGIKFWLNNVAEQFYNWM